VAFRHFRDAFSVILRLSLTREGSCMLFWQTSALFGARQSRLRGQELRHNQIEDPYREELCKVEELIRDRRRAEAEAIRKTWTDEMLDIYRACVDEKVGKAGKRYELDEEGLRTISLCCRTMPNTLSRASRTREGVNEQINHRLAGGLGASGAARNLEPLIGGTVRVFPSRRCSIQDTRALDKRICFTVNGVPPRTPAAII
ncbi:hypothetical protein Tco_0941958, partial [Tanacetum coccineum]